ncbi:chalcone isomerase family protein [Micavibrio aeruginosavorus]|uniref:Putative exported protein n=1 Tax=Micavibrio aeruginosavorus (strain ARL-13) TaxID=856793 RepID=G2KS01_MICAA|nr:chalcone isomerase family protein [Micavibrio aeruginosavorus]AEP10509.1 putative exported protein [Micavibrio aeruginosavorus ARL-13]
MRSVVRTACALAMIGITPVYAAEYVSNHVPEAKLVGQGRAQVLLWDVYEAKLYAPRGVYDHNKPFALELNYLQELEGRKIADHAVSEMRRLGYGNEVKLAAWHDQMSRIFPDVSPGSVITGVYVPGGPAIFFEEDRQIGRVNDPAFGREFFRIWFDAQTSTPALRQSLLNLNHSRKDYDHESPEKSHSSGGGHGS